MYTLTRAYPYLTPALQGQLRAYLQQQFAEYFNPTMYARKGWAEGAPREVMDYPQEIRDSFATQPKRASVSGWSWFYPQHNFYAMWKYAQIVPEDAVKAYTLAKSKLVGSCARDGRPRDQSLRAQYVHCRLHRFSELARVGRRGLDRRRRYGRKLPTN